MKNLIKNMFKNDNFKIVFYSLGFYILILIFDKIADIYNMVTLHRIICILSISFTHAFFAPLFNLFCEKIKNNKK